MKKFFFRSLYDADKPAGERAGSSIPVTRLVYLPYDQAYEPDAFS